MANKVKKTTSDPLTTTQEASKTGSDEFGAPPIRVVGEGEFATVQELQPDGTYATPGAFKNGAEGGREPSEGEKSEQAEDKPRRGRPPKSEQTDPVDAIDYIAKLGDMNGIRIYIYRLGPVIDRRAGGGRLVNLYRYDGRKFDANDLMLRFGSGVYQIRVNRTTQPEGKTETIFTGEVSILNMDYPPKVPRGEWVDDPDNKAWSWAKDMWDKPTAEQDKQAVSGPDPLVSILEKELARRDNELQEMRKEMREVANRKDPEKETVMSIILNRVLEPPKTDPTVLAILERLSQPAKNPLEPIILAIITDKLKDKGGEDGTLDKYIKIQKELNALAPEATGHSRMSGTQELAAEITKHVSTVLAPLAQPVGNLIAHTVIMNQQKAAREEALRQQQQPGAQQQPQQAPPAQEAQQPQQQPPAAVVAINQPQARPQQAQPQQAKPSIEAFAKEMLDGITHGRDGYQLGDWYLEEYGDDEFTAARSQGVAAILTDLKRCALWGDLQPFEASGKLAESLTQFVAWEAPPEEEPKKEEPQQQGPSFWGPAGKESA